MASPLPLRTHLPSYAPRPKHVDICFRTACDRDLNKVKAEVQQFVYNPVSSVEAQPNPAWLFESLSKAIRWDDVEMVQFLLENKVATYFPAEIAVRSRALRVLELFLQLRWDINQPKVRNNLSVLRYHFQYLIVLLFTYTFGILLCSSDRDMVTWLLDHNANPNSCCDWDFTQTSYAILAAPIDIINYLF